MKLKTTDGRVIEIPDAVILRAAGMIYASRRKVCAGPPKHVFRCRHCDGEIHGRVELDRHERTCDQRQSSDLIELTDEDMLSLVWTGPDAA
jgi:hypothetical protein